MTTDFRALCAELLGVLTTTNPSAFGKFVALEDRARAALAEPQPPAGGAGELVASEIVRNLRTKAATEKANACHYSATLLTRAADLLELLAATVKQSLSVEPTDEELLASLRYLYADQTAADMGAKDDLRTARAVLARWGNYPAQPVPVSERLPEAGDCTGDGCCWVWNFTAYTWGLFRLDPTVHSHWLPAAALPLPSGEVTP